VTSEKTHAPWPKTSLLDVADLVRGVSYKREEARTEPGSGLVPVLRANNINGAALNFTDLVYVPARRVSQEQRIRRGDIVLAMSSGSRDVVGKAALARTDWPGGFGAFCGVLRVRPGIDAGYVSKFLQSAEYRRQIDTIATGTNINNLSKTTLKNIELPLAPEEVQTSLSALLDVIDEKRIGSAAHLSAAKRTADRFRQAVLAMACSGRLTANWRRDSTDGSSAMADVLAEMAVAQKNRKLRRGVDPDAKTDNSLDALDLPSTWTVATVSALLASGALEDVKDGNHGANHPKVSEFTASGLPFITANVVKAGSIDYNAAPKLSGEALARLRVGFAEPGDLVLTHKASVGRVAINTAPSVLTPQTTYYRADQSVLSTAYLALFFESLYFYRQLAAVMSQTTRDFVPISEQYLLSVVLPPPAEQAVIIQRVRDLLRLAGDLTQQIEAASRRVERSSQSVLAKAFRGDLMPASELLGRPNE
jgi:type I restriction enzyme S subunit